MNREQIKALFEDLARSQGFYGRLLASMTDEAWEYLEQQNFQSDLDVILFIEC